MEHFTAYIQLPHGAFPVTLGLVSASKNHAFLTPRFQGPNGATADIYAANEATLAYIEEGDTPSIRYAASANGTGLGFFVITGYVVVLSI